MTVKWKTIATKTEKNDKNNYNNDDNNGIRRSTRSIRRLRGICNKFELVNTPKWSADGGSPKWSADGGDDVDVDPRFKFTKIHWAGGKNIVIKFKVELKYLCKNMESVVTRVDSDIRRMLFKSVMTTPKEGKHHIPVFQLSQAI